MKYEKIWKQNHLRFLVLFYHFHLLCCKSHCNMHLFSIIFPFRTNFFSKYIIKLAKHRSSESDKIRLSVQRAVEKTPNAPRNIVRRENSTVGGHLAACWHQPQAKPSMKLVSTTVSAPCYLFGEKKKNNVGLVLCKLCVLFRILNIFTN